MSLAIDHQTRQRRVGRRQINHAQTMVRLPEGGLDRLRAVLRERETQAAFLREAVMNAIEQREAEPTEGDRTSGDA